ncbi:hypothetical protein BGZ79_003281 [Entomortierella chlamydospora]|nr:hypothetical protein BGZ79_003281 [Entomortierella chlamydospora]
MLRLPDSSASWRQFLSGSTLSVLLAYVKHLTDLIERIEEQGLLHEQHERIRDCHTPERELRVLGDFTFFNPTKLQPQKSNGSYSQAEDFDIELFDSMDEDE